MMKRDLGASIASRMSSVAGVSRTVLSSVASKAKAASPEVKSTALGGVAGGAAAGTAGAHVGIAAFGTAVSGAALLPVALCIGVGAVAGYAGYKMYKDVRARRDNDRNAEPKEGN